jgi:hypothetical protein
VSREITRLPSVAVEARGYRSLVQPPTALALRRGVLAVSVLHDVDAEPAALGVCLPGSPVLWVSWGECRRALAGHDPEDEAGRQRLAAWLLARRWAADADRAALAPALRPVGLPVDHLLHPGLDWVRTRVLGDALDLGLGAVGLDPRDPDRVVLLPRPALDAAGIDPALAWTAVEPELERLGSLAAERLRLDPRGQLRPLGDCDVVTLLGARSLRAALAEAARGMASVVAPMRRRGWTRLGLIDPAFGPAAAAATPAPERGFARPLLLTADELTVVPEGGRPQVLALMDPAADRPWDRDVLYR